MEALFLEHEGYFGAVGAFLQSAFREDVDSILSWSTKPKSRRHEKHAFPQTIVQARSSDDLLLNRRRSDTSMQPPHTTRPNISGRRRAFTFDQFVDISSPEASQSKDTSDFGK